MLFGRTDPSGRARARCWACLGLSALAAVAAGCSTGGNRKDQNYGKDVGTVYEPPEAAAAVDSAGTSDGGTTDATPLAGDGGADTTAGADGDDALASDAG